MIGIAVVGYGLWGQAWFATFRKRPARSSFRSVISMWSGWRQLKAAAAITITDNFEEVLHGRK